MSKLVSCKSCGKEVAKGSKSCPSCGKDNRNFFAKHKIITGFLALAIISALGSGIGDGDNSNLGEDSEVSNNTIETQKQDNKVNYDNFTKVKMEMSYDEVVALLGEGTESSSSEISGIKSTMYTWNGKGISNMNVTIQNDIVTGKAQFGLESMDAKVTLEQFSNIKEGMSYEEVVGIIGEGQVSSETKIFNLTSIMYEWINKDGSNMNAIFDSDTLTMKSQFNLK